MDAKDPAFRQDLAAELTRRGIRYDDCTSKINGQNVGLALVAVGALATVAAVGCGQGQCSSGGGYYAPAHSYQWDEFTVYGQPQWRCRDTSNGEFADEWRCPVYKVDAYPGN